MTRPLDQADVDAVLERRYGRESIDNLTIVETFSVREDALGWAKAFRALGWTPPARPEPRFFWRTRNNSYTSNEWQTAGEQAATFTKTFPGTIVEIVDERTLSVHMDGSNEVTVIEGWEGL